MREVHERLSARVSGFRCPLDLNRSRNFWKTFVDCAPMELDGAQQ
jgi:hypothetical protein